MNEMTWVDKGWECPKCGAVMSPTTSVCINCRGDSNDFNRITINDTISLEDILKRNSINVGTETDGTR